MKTTAKDRKEKVSVRRGLRAFPSQKHLDKRGRTEEEWFDEQIKNIQVVLKGEKE